MPLISTYEAHTHIYTGTDIQGPTAGIGMVWYSSVLTSHSTPYRSFQRRFYGSDDPTNSVVSLKDDG